MNLLPINMHYTCLILTSSKVVPYSFCFVFQTAFYMFIVMIRFAAIIQKFGEQGEKTGWTYLIVPGEVSNQLLPGNKKTFRVKGKLDKHSIAGVAIMPMGGGDFILPVNAAMRKNLNKSLGEEIIVQLQVDTAVKPIDEELMACLSDEPEAMGKFKALAPGHQRYFSNWVEGAKTAETKARRIAHSLHFLSLGKDYGSMIRALKKEKENL
jgi:hypothetical protein